MTEQAASAFLTCWMMLAVIFAAVALYAGYNKIKGGDS